MRICLVGAKSCPPRIGGIEVFVHEVGKRLASKGAEVTAVVARYPDEKSEEQVDGINVRRIWSGRSRYFMKVSMMPGVARSLSDIRPDLIHANDPPSGLIASTRRGHHRSLLTVHGVGFSQTEWPTPFRQGGTLLQMMAVKGVTKTVTTDERTASCLKRFRDDILVIPPGVDTEVFRRHSYPRPESFGSAEINIIFAGRLTKVKGFDLLLESLGHIESSILSKTKVTVIGDGPLSDLMKGSALRPGLIDWVGERPHDAMPPYFSNADLIVMPSRSEGLPISMLEAMASGLPVVSTDVGGIWTFFDERHLTRIRATTGEAVATAIEKALVDKRALEEKAKAAMELVSSRFSWERVAGEYYHLYQRILEG